MERLKEILKTEMKKYAGKKDHWLILPIFDEKRDHYLIMALDYPSRKEPANLLIMARIKDDKIIIEDDLNDNKLVDALLQQGVPREQITLVYAGEPAPPPPIPVIINAKKDS